MIITVLITLQFTNLNAVVINLTLSMPIGILQTDISNTISEIKYKKTNPNSYFDTHVLDTNYTISFNIKNYDLNILDELRVFIKNFKIINLTVFFKYTNKFKKIIFRISIY